MAAIRATCAACGDVELTSADVRARICVDNGAASYCFRCPVCAVASARPTEPHIIDLLVGSGVELTAWRLPAELFESHSGPAITHDDLLDFHQALRGSDWIAAFTDRVEGPRSTS
ncbi:MAG: hypothetical protein ABIV94_00955 [Acidimicrobiales bacterium]